MNSLLERLIAYAELVRLHRPIGILLLLWPALWALWLASAGQPDMTIVLIFIAGTVLMRSAGCAINDYADRDFDGHVTRTKNRPLATGRIHPIEALLVFAVLSLLAFALVLLLNLLTIVLAFAALATTMLYPFMKRFTQMPQLVLGIAFGWAVPMAYTAQTGSIPLQAWLLFAATVLWAMIYDTMYAMADRDDDRKIGIQSTAILFGAYDRLIIGLLQLLMLALLLWVGVLAELGLWFGLALALGAGLFIYQQWLIRHRQAAQCLQAFLNNHWFGLVLFVGIAIDFFWN